MNGNFKDYVTKLPETASLNMLVVGMIGAGKTYVIKRLIERLDHVPNVRFVLIDPKMVELEKYRLNLKTKWYADNDEDIFDVLHKVYDLMWDRYRYMKAHGQDVTEDDHIVVFVDEMYFMMTGEHKKEYVNMFTKLIVMGRSAHIHVVLCTQNANRSAIPTGIRDNCPNIICLRQEDETRYRYLLGKSYPELPEIGFAYVKTPHTRRPVKVRSEEIWDTLMDRPDVGTATA